MQTTASAASERSRSSLLETDRTCWSVLDLDSHETGAFGDADEVGLQEVLRAGRLTVE